jgi:hypothetical protein
VNGKDSARHRHSFGNFFRFVGQAIFNTAVESREEPDKWHNQAVKVSRVNWFTKVH